MHGGAPGYRPEQWQTSMAKLQNGSDLAWAHGCDGTQKVPPRNLTIRRLLHAVIFQSFASGRAEVKQSPSPQKPMGKLVLWIFPTV